jgi:hypothetical protein
MERRRKMKYKLEAFSDVDRIQEFINEHNVKPMQVIIAGNLMSYLLYGYDEVKKKNGRR